MSPLSIAIYTLVFVVLSVQFTGSYSKFNITEPVWTVISVISVVILVASFIIERMTKKKESDR